MAGSWLFTRVLESYERGGSPKLRKWMWRRLYNLLSWSWRDQDWRFMNYGYVPAGAPLVLEAADEPERAFIGLYAQALDGLAPEGKRILEVGCGRGGGLRYIARYLRPAAAAGLDYSPDTVRRARLINQDTPGLAFEVGDAEHLPFADASFDIVVNIESSHCYGDVPAFFSEVKRVLVPGGWFTFADMRGADQVAALDAMLEASGLEMAQKIDLTPGVVAALDLAESRKQARMARLGPLRAFVSEFSGARGSTLYQALARGETAYVARRLRKPL